MTSKSTRPETKAGACLQKYYASESLRKKPLREPRPLKSAKFADPTRLAALKAPLENNLVKINKADADDIKLLDGFGLALRASAASYHEELLSFCATIFAVAQHLYTDDDRWISFCSDPGWTEVLPRYSPGPSKQGKALMFAFLRALDPHKKQQRKKATKYARALQAFFDEGVVPDEIPERIRAAGGIEKLARAGKTGSVTTPGEAKPVADNSAAIEVFKDLLGKLTEKNRLIVQRSKKGEIKFKIKSRPS